MYPGGQVEPGEGKGDPGTDLARKGEVVAEPLEVDGQCVRKLSHLYKIKNLIIIIKMFIS